MIDKRTTLPVLYLISLLMLVPMSLSQSALLSISLEYNSGTIYDINNDGVENTNNAIDFTIANSNIHTSLDKAKLCTRWTVHSLDSSESTNICYGNEACCNFMQLVPTMPEWDEEFYLTYGQYGATENNEVSSELLYVDYDLDPENPSSEIHYSESATLSASFNSVGLLSTPNEFVFGDVLFTVNSPAQTIESGEDVQLNVNANRTILLSYILDSNSLVTLDSGSSFGSALQGGLPNNVIENGQHNIEFFIDSLSLNYTFSVDDQNAPTISLNISNNSAISSPGDLDIQLMTDEYSVISYELNGNGASSNIEVQDSYVITLTPQPGTNSLRINSIDLQGNSQQHYFEFTFSESSACNDGIMNGDEEGIDCGGSCGTCIPFNISLDKTEFNLGEQVFLSVVARQESTVDLIVTREGSQVYSHTFTPVFPGAPIVETRLLENINTAGTYTAIAVMNYLDNTETLTRTFTVSQQQNSLSVSISANSTDIREGDTINFTSSVSGAQGSLTYKWDFDNDKTSDSSASSPSYRFTNNGSFKVNATAYDGTNEASTLLSINVRKMYNVTISTFSNKTNDPIPNVDIRFGDERKNSSSSGYAFFTDISSSYNLRIEKEGYKTYSKSFSLNENIHLRVNLTTVDIKPPVIVMNHPANKALISSNSTQLKFTAQDSHPMTCSVYLQLNNSEFASPYHVAYAVQPNTETTVNISGLLQSAYKWRVNCADADGNTNMSSTYFFSVGEQAPQQSAVSALQAQEGSDIVELIDLALEDLKKLGAKEKKIAETMDLQSWLERSKLDIERANRDIASLVWRNLNESEQAVEEQKIQDRIDATRDNTPRSIEVLESTEFVKYPEKEEIANILQILINQSNKKVSKKELRTLLDHNDKLQSAITVTTKAHHIAVEYISGSGGIVTLIEKDVSISDDISGLRLFESIPSIFAQDIDDITILFEYEQIEDKNILEIDSEKVPDIVYYVKKEVPLNYAENTQAILMEKDLDIKEKSFLTGLAVFDGFSIAKGTDIRLIIEIVIILLLAAIYLVYSFGGVEHFRVMFQGKDIKELQTMIHDSEELLHKEGYDIAKPKYKEASLKFSKLDAKMKEKVKGDLVELTNEMNLFYIKQLAGEARKTAKQDKKKVIETYKKIQSLYKIIPKKHKATISKQCLELHKELKAK